MGEGKIVEEIPLCRKYWVDKYGKEHTCHLLPKHGLTCECSCGARKWMGEKLEDRIFRSKLNKERIIWGLTRRY